MGNKKEILWIKGFLDALLLQDEVKLMQLKSLSRKLEQLIKDIEFQEINRNKDNTVFDDDLPF